MKMTRRSRYCKFLVVVSLPLSVATVASLGNTAQAQIIPDETLGTEGSVVTPLNGQADRIDGGAARGSNLFHSFREFNIGEGRGAYFANPAVIENIFSRVTGSNPSHLLGTLGVLGDANLFFLNPNGIIFGKNASLDIRGSLVTSTANSLIFPDGDQFSATNPQAPPLLEVNAPIPIGLQFEGEETGAIINAGELEAGANLTLVGGTVASTGKLSAPGELVSVAAVPEASLVKLGAEGQLLGWERSPIPSDTEAEAGGLTLPELLTQAGDDTGLRVVSDGQVELVESGIQFAANPGTAIVSGTIDASNIALGQTGGTVYVLGDRVGLVDKAQVNVSGDAGGGKVLIGGDFQGKGSLPNAARTFVGSGTTINADAIRSGDGGRVIVWSEEATRFYGNISARGGVNSGNGGFVEVSSPQLLDFKGQVNTRAPNGATGTLLLDPTNIEVVGFFSPDADTDDLRDVDEFDDSDLGIDNTTRIDASAFSSAFTNVILQATNDIIFNAGVFLFTPGIGLTAEAGNNVIVNNLINTSGGEVQLIAGNDISLTNPSAVISTLGGNVALNAEDNIFLEGASVITNNIEDIFGGSSGDIQVKSRSLSMRNGASLLSDNFFSAEKGGDVTIETERLIVQKNSGISTETFGSGDAGDLTIRTERLTLQEGGLITTQTLNVGDAGDLVILASDSVELRQKSDIFSTTNLLATTNSAGEGGNLTIETGRLIVQDGSNVSASSNSAGNAGNLAIEASESLEIRNLGLIQAQANNTGDGGNINIKTPRLTIQDGVGIIVATFDKAKAGEVIVNAYDSVELIGNNSSISSFTFGSGPAGDIKINTGRLLVQEGSISAQTFDAGEAGNLMIDTGRLLVQEGIISAATDGAGAAGDLTIQASESVILNGPSSITNNNVGTTVFPGATGDGGDLTITTRQLTVQNGATVQAGTFGEGSSGNLTVTASDSVELTGFGSRLLTQTEGSGNAGELTISTGQLRISDRADVSAATFGGESDGIKVTANTLEGTNGGKVVTTTGADKDAGDIILEIVDSVTLEGQGSGLFADTLTDSTGDGGSISIDPRTVIIRDGARVAVNSQGEGKGGDINIFSGSLTLDNEAAISAITESTDGGNITLQIDDDPLLLRGTSSISTNAGTDEAGGDGGNIEINAPFIIAFPSENSDITANANLGDGGSIEITTNAIFGIEFRDNLTPLSDFTVSSEFGAPGVFVEETLGIDATRGLITLPEETVNTEISQGCQTVRGKEAVEYFELGRGGLPPNPSEPLNADAAIEDWIDLESMSDNGSDSGTTINSPHTGNTELISPCPAQ